MNFAKFLLLAILFVSSFTSHASNWVKVTQNESMAIFADTETIRRTDATVQIWTKWAFKQPKDAADSNPKMAYQSTKDLSVIRCDDRTTVTLQSTKYADADAAGDVVSTSDSYPDTPSRYRHVLPDSIGEIILEYACKKGKEIICSGPPGAVTCSN